MAPRAAARVAPSRSFSSAATCGGCAQGRVMAGMLHWLSELGWTCKEKTLLN